MTPSKKSASCAGTWCAARCPILTHLIRASATCAETDAGGVADLPVAPRGASKRAFRKPLENTDTLHIQRHPIAPSEDNTGVAGKTIAGATAHVHGTPVNEHEIGRDGGGDLGYPLLEMAAEVELCPVAWAYTADRMLDAGREFREPVGLQTAGVDESVALQQRARDLQPAEVAPAYGHWRPAALTEDHYLRSFAAAGGKDTGTRHLEPRAGGRMACAFADDHTPCTVIAQQADECHEKGDVRGVGRRVTRVEVRLEQHRLPRPHGLSEPPGQIDGTSHPIDQLQRWLRSAGVAEAVERGPHRVAGPRLAPHTSNHGPGIMRNEMDVRTAAPHQPIIATAPPYVPAAAAFWRREVRRRKPRWTA